jgi:hypothetical protein
MQLPPELLEHVLLQCVASGDRAACRELRLTCRLFDRILKPHVCRTVSLSFRHINRSGIRPRPRVEALDTVGAAAKVLNIDMSVVRDRMEVKILKSTLGARSAVGLWDSKDFKVKERAFRGCCLKDSTCDEEEYFEIVDDILRRCDNIHTLRLVLPNPFIPTPCDAPTYILMNTIAAFSDAAERCRDERIEPIRLAETIIIENFTDQMLIKIFHNPVDIEHHLTAFEGMKNLVLTMRDPDLIEMLDTYIGDERNFHFWRFITLANETLESICISRADHSPRSRPRPPVAKPSLAVQRPRSMDMVLPPRNDSLVFHPTLPHPGLPVMTRLELKDVTIEAGGFLRRMIMAAGPTLRELYLDSVDMEVEPAGLRNLWIGVPNRRPHCLPPTPLDITFNPYTDRYPEWWAAPLVRDGCPRLEIVRATDLCYVSFRDGWEDHDPDSDPGFDTRDPSGLGRTIAQRFVEVVLGYDQPDAPPNPAAIPLPIGIDLDTGGPRDTIDPVLGGHVRYWPYNPADDAASFANLRPRPPGALRAEDHDLAAYRLAGGANTTSSWLRSVDGAFPNVPAATDDPAVDAWIDSRLEGLLRERREGDPRGDYTRYLGVVDLMSPTHSEMDDLERRMF